jgi:hypothetical protein
MPTPTPAPTPDRGNPWPDRLRDCSEELRVSFEYGHANAPDSPGGRDILILGSDGKLRLRNEGRQRTEWQAQTDPAVIRRFFEILSELHFPQIASDSGHVRVPSGISQWVVRAQFGSERVSAGFSTAYWREKEPARSLFLIGCGLIFRIRGSASHLSDSLGLTVQDIVVMPPPQTLWQRLLSGWRRGLSNCGRTR